MLMLMWGAIFFTSVLILNALFAVLDWASLKHEWNRDTVELQKRARFARLSLLLIPLGVIWPIALPVAVVYGVVLLIKSLNKDSEHNL